MDKEEAVELVQQFFSWYKPGDPMWPMRHLNRVFREAGDGPVNEVELLSELERTISETSRNKAANAAKLAEIKKRPRKRGLQQVADEDSGSKWYQ